MRISEVGRFFGLVLILSLPFYALGIAGNALPFASALPISALMAIVPMIAALGLIIRQSGSAAAGTLFKSALAMRPTPNAWWALLSLSIMPAAFALTGSIIWLSGTVIARTAPSPTQCYTACFRIIPPWRGSRRNRLARLCLSPTDLSIFAAAGCTHHWGGLGTLAYYSLRVDRARCDMDHVAQFGDGPDAEYHRLAVC